MTKNSKKYSYFSLARDIYEILGQYQRNFWLASLMRVSGDLVYLYTSYALSRVVSFFSHYQIGTSLNAFWPLLIFWSLGYLYSNNIRQASKFFCYKIAEKINLDTQLKAFHQLGKLDIAWHEKENTGNRLKRIENGGQGLENVLRIWINNLIEISVNFTGMIIVVSFIDLNVGLIMVAFLLTYLIIVLPLSGKVVQAARVVSQHEEDLHGLAFETLNNIRSIKVMGMFGRLSPRLESQSAKVYSAIVKRINIFRIKTFIQTNWSHFFRIIAIIFIVFGITRGRYDLGFLVMFNFYFTTLRMSVEELSTVSQELVIARHHIYRLKNIFSEKVLIDDDTGKINFPDDWQTIRFDKVSFSYADNVVLKNISFEIKRGEKVGVVGLSGAGKSTLFKLLLKEYENFTGDILFDDISIRRIKKSSFYEKAAVVLQDTEVFNFSLKDNITIASSDNNQLKERLNTAITVAHITDFMHKLPQGLDTLIGEKGVKLSGGEKQRVGIARAIFKKPNILFLDEATSHLDLESEEKIKDSLHHFFQEVTAIVIAHRLTTIAEMDKILLFENGEVIESGDFESLCRQKGRFFDLWNKQKF